MENQLGFKLAEEILPETVVPVGNGIYVKIIPDEHLWESVRDGFSDTTLAERFHIYERIKSLRKIIRMEKTYN